MLYIILVNYNFGQLILDAIQSIKEPDINHRIIIYDNNSRDHSISLIKSLNDNKIDLIESKENIGFSAGINRAFDFIKEKHGIPGFIYLMNPDSTIPERLLYHLMHSLEAFNADVVSPKIIDSNGEAYFDGGFIDMRRLRVFNVSKPLNGSNEIRYTNLFQGASVMIKGDVFNEMGGLNEELFMYFDEVDFSIRLLEKDYKILYDPERQVSHYTSYSLRRTSHLKAYYISRNYLYTFSKLIQKPKGTYLMKMIRFQFDWLLIYLKSLKFKCVFYQFLGCLHFLTGRKGKL